MTFIQGAIPKKSAEAKRVSRAARAKPSRLREAEKPGASYEVYKPVQPVQRPGA